MKRLTINEKSKSIEKQVNRLFQSWSNRDEIKIENKDERCETEKAERYISSESANNYSH